MRVRCSEGRERRKGKTQHTDSIYVPPSLPTFAANIWFLLLSSFTLVNKSSLVRKEGRMGVRYTHITSTHIYILYILYYIINYIYYIIYIIASFPNINNIYIYIYI